jgi:hypothetical protein
MTESWEGWPDVDRIVLMQEKRDARRLKRRRTKMVMDNAGVRDLKAVNIPDGKVGNRGGRNRPKR